MPAPHEPSDCSKSSPIAPQGHTFSVRGTPAAALKQHSVLRGDTAGAPAAPEPTGYTITHGDDCASIPVAPDRKLLRTIAVMGWQVQGLLALAASVICCLLPSPTTVFAQANKPLPTVSRPKDAIPTPGGVTPPLVVPALPGTPVTHEPQPPSPDTAMEAYRLIRKQFDEWAVVTLPPATKRSGIATAAAVQVRFDNQLRGRGSFVSMSAAGDDAITVAHRAAMEAFSEADRRMPVDRDALRRETVARLGATATISIEIAGPTTPLNVQSYAQLERTGLVRPGLDAILAVCKTKSAALLPSQQIIANLSPAEAARQLVAIVTDNPQLALEDLDKVMSKHGVRLYKAATTHIAEHPLVFGPGDRAEPTESSITKPMFLTRGARLIPRSELDSETELLAFADAMAANLIARMHPGSRPLGLRGTHLPWLGTFVPEVASPIEQALAAHALGRYAAVQSQTANPATNRSVSPAAETAARLWRELEQVDPSESPFAGDADTAISILALLPADIVETTARLRSTLEKAAGGPVDWVTRPPPVQGIATLAALRGLPGNAQLQGLRRLLFAGTTPEKMPGMMPFLAVAEFEDHPGSKGELPAATRLREMRTLIWSGQLTAGPGSGPDLVGGIVFGAASGGYPTWSAAGPLAAIAAMMADERTTTKAERGGEIVRMIEALRFSRQLMIDANSSWCCATPSLAIGAIRAAPFDWRCPPDATSMTLLAVCETIDSLRAMK